MVDNSVLSSLEKKDQGSVKGKNKKNSLPPVNWKDRAKELEQGESLSLLHLPCGSLLADGHWSVGLTRAGYLPPRTLSIPSQFSAF